MEMGLLGGLGLLLSAPFAWWQNQAAKWRLLSPHEINLRRATQPLGFIAVLAWFVWVMGARTIRGALAPVLLLDPAANWLPLALLAALLLYGFASFLAGVRGCWGVRSDPMLPVRAFARLALGGGGLALLMSNEVTRRTAPDLWTALGWLLVTFVAVWWAAVAAARLVLLNVGGGSALGLVNRHIRQTQVVMRPARARRWWMFWKFW
jgi:hypothetical protein